MAYEDFQPFSTNTWNVCLIGADEDHPIDNVDITTARGDQVSKQKRPVFEVLEGLNGFAAFVYGILGPYGNFDTNSERIDYVDSEVEIRTQMTGYYDLQLKPFIMGTPTTGIDSWSTGMTKLNLYFTEKRFKWMILLNGIPGYSLENTYGGSGICIPVELAGMPITHMKDGRKRLTLKLVHRWPWKNMVIG